jgi:hypothetical protein
VLPQPPRPTHGFIDFVPNPGNFEDGSVGEKIWIGQLCDLCDKIRDWLVHVDSCKSGESCSTCSLPKEEIPHHETGAELEESFKNGCHMCTHLWCSFVHKTGRPYDVQLLRSAGRVWLTLMSFWLLGWEAHIQVKEEEWVGEELHLRRSRRYQPSGASSSSSSGGSYETVESDEEENEEDEDDEIKDGEANPGAGGDSGRPQLAALSHTRTASTASFELVKGWMRQCTESHPRCKERPACALPRRLLKVFYEVTETETVRIVRLVDTDSLPAADTSGSDSQYAALSYCWGRSTPFTLTASSEQVLRDGVPIDQLPKTIQHAAYTTLKLDIEWLWVDSLCIFQDSAEDWSREAGTMFDVYQGSYITIAALGASDNSHGLFAHRDPLLYAPCRLIPGADGSSEYLYPVWSQGETLKAWPLHQRGWVVQERVLPPRTVKFGLTLKILMPNGKSIRSRDRIGRGVTGRSEGCCA